MLLSPELFATNLLSWFSGSLASCFRIVPSICSWARALPVKYSISVRLHRPPSPVWSDILTWTTRKSTSVFQQSRHICSSCNSKIHWLQRDIIDQWLSSDRLKTNADKIQAEFWTATRQAWHLRADDVVSYHSVFSLGVLIDSQLTIWSTRLSLFILAVATATSGARFTDIGHVKNTDPLLRLIHSLVCNHLD